MLRACQRTHMLHSTDLRQHWREGGCVARDWHKDPLLHLATVEYPHPVTNYVETMRDRLENNTCDKSPYASQACLSIHPPCPASTKLCQNINPLEVGYKISCQNNSSTTIQNHWPKNTNHKIQHHQSQKMPLCNSGYWTFIWHFINWNVWSGH